MNIICIFVQHTFIIRIFKTSIVISNSVKYPVVINFLLNSCQYITIAFLTCKEHDKDISIMKRLSSISLK